MLRHERGFTLPEVLVALTIGLILSIAAFSLVEFVMKRAGDVAARVDTSQRARTAMDQITRQLRGQVCLSTDVNPIVAGDGDSAEFYVDFGDQSDPNVPPERHLLKFDSTKQTITETTYTGTSNGASPPVFTYDTSKPMRVRTLLTNVTRYNGTPIFQYYGFNAASPPRPDLSLGSSIDASNLDKVARIDVTFKAFAAGKTASTVSIVMQDQVFVRQADPNSLTPDPVCS
jgi:prepilin-type N-terminal cleavage/methylation domain-containing protein